MRCGNCKSEHDSVNDVRECYGHKVEQGNSVWPASDKQVVYADGLQQERILPGDYVVKTTDELSALDRDQVSSLINLLKTFPKKDAGQEQRSWEMPAGRYALMDDDNVWQFYEISKPTDGRWKGYTFIKLLVGSPGDYRKVDMSVPRRYRTLGIIAANAKQAMLDYGLQSGVCGKCSSPLTDPQSLARGIGPICAGKTGWGV